MFADPSTLLEFDYGKVGSLEKFVQAVGEIESMARIGEGYLLVFGSRVGHQAVKRAQIDRLVLIEHSVDRVRTQYFLGFVGPRIGIGQQYSWFWSAHKVFL